MEPPHKYQPYTHCCNSPALALQTLLFQPYTRAVRTSAFTIIRFTNTLAIALHAPALHTQSLTKTLATALHHAPPAPTCVGSGLIMVVAPQTSSYQATNDKLVHHNYSPTV